MNKFSPEIQQAINDGIKDAGTDLDGVMKKINADLVSSGDMFGSRDFLKDNYLYRYTGAKLGLYGNSKQDALYFGYFVDANHQPFDASKSNYEIHFAEGRPAAHKCLLVAHHVRRQDAASCSESTQAVSSQLDNAQIL